MAEKHYTCKQCNAEFVASHKRSFCTDKCKWRHQTLIRNPAAKLIIPIQECKCKGCGKTYKPKAADRNKYCSRECAFKSGATSKYVRNGNEYDRPSPYTKVYFKICKQCAIGFVAKRSDKTICSDECSKKFKNLRQLKIASQKKIITTRSCKNCKKLFVAEYGNKKRLYCSELCGDRLNGRVNKAKRRARERSVEAENIDPFQVFDRDRWKCCLCGIKTLKSKRGTYDDRAPELDHIIPLSKGGKHTYANVQCACRRCNSAKNNKELGQLLLFG